MKTDLLNQMPLLPGETPLPKAPLVVLDDGTNCIPQHYLSYHHTKSSVSDIIANIEFDEKYVLFVDQDNASIFIQVGIIGKDNYQSAESQDSEKIVYGRRWRIEPQLPSSEIIQTAFLALMKAREHEIRELFKYKVCGVESKKENITTPFSCHHDLPLIAMSKATDSSTHSSKARYTLTNDDIEACLANIRYDHAIFTLNSMLPLGDDKHLLNIDIHTTTNTSLPEVLDNAGKNAHLIVESLNENSLLYAVMDYVLQLSNRYVEEHFTFKQFARFSRKQSIQKISALSARTRVDGKIAEDGDFARTFANANYETDTTRVPKISSGLLGEKIKGQLKSFDIQYGILPKNED
jgi:hypothetical protein